MFSPFFLLKVFLKPIPRLGLFLLICMASEPSQGEEVLTKSPADREWATLKAASETPPVPLENNPDRMLTPQELSVYYAKVSASAGDIADSAKRFFTQHPEHPKAGDARNVYFEMLHAAVSSGGATRVPELEAATAERVKAPGLDEDARFRLSLRLLKDTVAGRQYESNDAMRAELEKRAVKLAADFPEHPEGLEYLLKLARNATPAKSVAMVPEILSTSNDARVKNECQGFINRADAVGKPLCLKLSLPDGSELDLEKMRGKVVCLLFWDTVSEFSEKAVWSVDGLYKNYHSKGVEVWGLNFDENQDKAKVMLQDHHIEWPQYADVAAGRKIQEKFGLYALPTVWLIDKKGVLRELRAERGPDPIIQKLLAE
jgi:hypothetical protein